MAYSVEKNPRNLRLAHEIAVGAGDQPAGTFDDAIDQRDTELRSFQDGIFAQDRPTIESQRPERLPLDLQEELHPRSDRLSIAHRKWLRERGYPYGIS
ncbi:hypothetical protein [Planctomycetes bacterium Pan216]|uniref:hypothetical protein n=1 Tax=Kolteria novifilia TaxID=2527975 RepID=UPI00119DBAD8